MTQQDAAGERTNSADSSLSVPQLLQACRTGDASGWEQLVGLYGPLVYAVPLHYGLQEAEAADIAQIVFTALLHSLDTLDDDSNLVNWLALVARRHAWRVRRSRQPVADADLDRETLAALLAQLAENAPPLPPEVHHVLTQRFADYAQSGSQPGPVQWRHAALTDEGLHRSIRSDLRASVDDLTPQFLFDADLMDVILNVQPYWIGERLDLIGQLLPTAANLAIESFVVQLLREDEEVATTLTNEIGEFWFAALEPGSYTLLVSTDMLEIEVPHFTLRNST